MSDIKSNNPHLTGGEKKKSSHVYRSKPRRIHVWYICLHLVDFDGKLVGKYTSPMDASWELSLCQIQFRNLPLSARCSLTLHKSPTVTTVVVSTWRIIPLRK